MFLLDKIFKNHNQKDIDNIKPIVEKINSLESEYKDLKERDFSAKTQELKERIKKGEDITPLAFALVREAAYQTLGQRAFDTQVMGAILLDQGKVVEMKTGEGKTLTATMAVYKNALEGKGVHVVTVNDYLSRRDAVWMGQVYHLLGLKTACINHEQAFLYDPTFKQTDEQKDEKRDELGYFYIVEDYLRPCSRQEAYDADITYGTNNEFGFDYLRSNMVYSKKDQIRFGFNFCIIDEVDSVLIDEARTPLIISGPMPESPENYYRFAQVAKQLTKDKDYEIEEKTRSIKFTEAGEDRIVNILGDDPWQNADLKKVHRLENAIKAKEFYILDKEYVVKNNEIIIVDEFTGRLMPGRRWSNGLHQAVEAKEHTSTNSGVIVNPESISLATITFQNLFRKYKKLSGMTGTAQTSAEEFDKVYELDVVSVPTNKPIIRKDLDDKIYKTEKEKYDAIVKEIKEVQEKGSPVLVGTRSIAKNEYISNLLSRNGIKHQVLNAKNHDKEASIIADAGIKGSVTIATNMAGRGVDIILGGAHGTKEDRQEIKDLGGLYVIGTERHEARRIDDQLRGRSGRQGDPGQSQFFVSLEDDLMRIFGGANIKKMLDILKFPEGESIEEKRVSSAIEKSQQRVEVANFDARKYVLEYDDVMNKHREAFYNRRQDVLEESNDKLLERFKAALKKNDKVTENFFNERMENIGKDKQEEVLRYVYLKVMDNLWIEHIQNMSYLKESVKLRAYGHLDPLVEYKRESFKLFETLFDTIDYDIIDMVSKIQKVEKKEEKKTLAQTGQKLKRNDKCHCGSGKKYKNCCWPN